MEPEEEPSVAAVREVCEEVCAKAYGYCCTLSQPTEWCAVIGEHVMASSSLLLQC